jgi:hypothetical protein
MGHTQVAELVPVLQLFVGSMAALVGSLVAGIGEINPSPIALRVDLSGT